SLHHTRNYRSSIHHTVTIHTSPLYLHSFPHPRHPPSFPTRRSSDLPRRFGRGHGRAGTARRAILRAAQTKPACAQVRPRQRDGRDRKSTRLNSSHLGISYAVFCLKKKRTSVMGMHRKESHTSSVPHT